MSTGLENSQLNGGGIIRGQFYLSFLKSEVVFSSLVGDNFLGNKREGYFWLDACQQKRKCEQADLRGEGTPEADQKNKFIDCKWNGFLKTFLCCYDYVLVYGIQGVSIAT